MFRPARWWRAAPEHKSCKTKPPRGAKRFFAAMGRAWMCADSVVRGSDPFARWSAGASTGGVCGVGRCTIYGRIEPTSMEPGTILWRGTNPLCRGKSALASLETGFLAQLNAINAQNEATAPRRKIRWRTQISARDSPPFGRLNRLTDPIPFDANRGSCENTADRIRH